MADFDANLRHARHSAKLNKIGRVGSRLDNWHDRPLVFHRDFDGAGGNDAAKFILTPTPAPAPRINGPKIYGARPGRPFVYRIPCTGVRPIRFSVEGLPSALRLDGSTGIITGDVPEQRGDYAMTLHASNEKGRGARTFKLVVGDRLALTPPMGWNDW